MFTLNLVFLWFFFFFFVKERMVKKENNPRRNQDLRHQNRKDYENARDLAHLRGNFSRGWKTLEYLVMHGINSVGGFEFPCNCPIFFLKMCTRACLVAFYFLFCIHQKNELCEWCGHSIVNLKRHILTSLLQAHAICVRFYTFRSLQLTSLISYQAAGWLRG